MIDVDTWYARHKDAYKALRERRDTNPALTLPPTIHAGTIQDTILLGEAVQTQQLRVLQSNVDSIGVNSSMSSAHLQENRVKIIKLQ